MILRPRDGSALRPAPRSEASPASTELPFHGQVQITRLRAPSIRPIRKLLVANRCEIAIRVLRAATELGIRTVAIYAHEDRFCPHRFKADEAYQLNAAKGPVGAYLDIEGIVALAKEKGVDAIHPGYGFLSENAEFAQACAEAGIMFVGPRPEVAASMMGDKTAARALAQKARACRPCQGRKNRSSDRERGADGRARRSASRSSSRRPSAAADAACASCTKPSDLETLLDEAQSEAGRAFGNRRGVPREVHRRAPSTSKCSSSATSTATWCTCTSAIARCSGGTRRSSKSRPARPRPESHRRACATPRSRIAQEVGYDNAGTVEFLVDLETGRVVLHRGEPAHPGRAHGHRGDHRIDLVRAQILIAQGHQLHGRKSGLPRRTTCRASGFAIQCRVTTEDPENKFMPDYGKILTYRTPAASASGSTAAWAFAGAVITPFYDSLLVKVTACGRTFEHGAATAWTARCASSASAA